MDVLAYGVADALGHPLMHPSDTNALGKKVASLASRLDGKLKEKARSAADDVRRATAAAAKDPTLRPRVAAAAAKGALARSQLLGEPYDPKVPEATVGAKRKPQDAPQAQVALRRAESAAARAKSEVERKQQSIEAAGPSPERPGYDAPVHTWRTFERTAQGAARRAVLWAWLSATSTKRAARSSMSSRDARMRPRPFSRDGLQPSESSSRIATRFGRSSASTSRIGFGTAIYRMHGARPSTQHTCLAHTGRLLSRGW
jgi:hypothetical protein